MIIFSAFLQALVFQLFSQTAKRLGEKGVSVLEVMSYQRYALYPAVLLLIVFWDQASVNYLLENHTVLFSFVGFIVLLCLFQYVYFSSLHITRSLALVSVIKNSISLPLLMVVGFFINGDVPMTLEYLSIGFLIVALFLQPKRSDGETSSLLHPLRIVIATVLVFVLLQILKDPLYRYFMQHIPNIWFGLLLYLSSFTLLLNVFFWIKKPTFKTRPFSEHKKLLPFLIAIPILWLIGSVPEGYSFSKLPVYSMIALGSITFLMSIGSDIYNKRIVLNMKAILFITFVCCSILLNVVAHI